MNLQATFTRKLNGNGSTELEVSEFAGIVGSMSIDLADFDPGSVQIEVSNGGDFTPVVDDNNDAIAAKSTAGGVFVVHPNALKFSKCRIKFTNTMQASDIIFLAYSTQG